MMRAAACVGICAALGIASLDAQEPAKSTSKSAALAPIDTADYDDRGRFRVNGKSFFPILLYDAPTGPPADRATLAELRDFGFNTLTCKSEACAALRELGFYGAVHHPQPVLDEASALFVLGADSPALYYKKDLLKQTAEANAKTHGALPTRPHVNAIGYWEDEPQGVVAGKLPSRAVYEDLVAAIDVSAPYLYPVPYQPVATVGDAVRRAREATGGKKPIVPILQLFAWDAAARYPTPTELRCMTYLALVEGASGIGYYSFGSVTGRPKTTIAQVQPELWRSVKGLNRELAEIGPKLAEGARPARIVAANAADVAPPAAATRAGAEVRSIAAAEGLPVVIVNPSDAARPVALSASERIAEVVLDDGRTIPIDAQGSGLTLKPLEVVVIRGVRRR